ncbi:MAG: cell division protein FtsK, partial [Gordonia amarae]
MGLFRTGLDVVQRRDEFRHVLKERRDDRAWERKQEENEQRREDRAREFRIKMAAQRQTAAQKAEDARQREAARAEKEVKSRPRTRYAGGTCKDDRLLAEPIMVHHHKADEAVVAILTPPGSGEPPLISAASFRMKVHPDIRDDAEWVETVGKPLHRLFKDVDTRYGGLLSKLRDHTWWRGVCLGAGVAMSHTYEESWKGKFSTGTRRVTEHVFPTVNAVRVAEDGLRIRISHRTGDTSKNWAKGIDALRASFKAAGAPAGRLRVVEDKGGNLMLIFDDAPSNFPKAIAPPTPTPVHSIAEAVRKYKDLHWEFGVDSKGKVLRSRVADSPHVALIAQTSWGKSVLSATIIEQMRCAGAMVMLFDGKGTDHPRHLGRQPGVIWLSKNPAAHMVGMAWAHAEMEDRYARVNAANDGPDTAKSFDFPPIFIVVDELPSLRAGMARADKTDKGALFDSMLVDLLQKGRQCRVHVLVISQSLYIASLPSEMQTNLTRTIFLGPVDSRSLMSDDIPQSAKDEVVRLSGRIREQDKGRAVYMQRGEGGVRVEQFQAYYGYSPGNTALDSAPTPEVADAWAAAKEVSEQMPSLYPRLGIRVDDAEWADAKMDELAKTPTVIVSDPNGPVQGMAKYDPLDPSFA